MAKRGPTKAELVKTYGAVRKALFPNSTELVPQEKLTKKQKKKAIQKSVEMALLGSGKQKNGTAPTNPEPSKEETPTVLGEPDTKALVIDTKHTEDKTNSSKGSRTILIGGSLITVSALGTLMTYNSGRKPVVEPPKNLTSSITKTLGNVKTVQLNVTEEHRKSVKLALMGTTVLGVFVGATFWALTNN